MYAFLDRYLKKHSTTDTHESKQAFRTLFLKSEDRSERMIAIRVIIRDPKAAVPKWNLKTTEALVIIGPFKLFLSLKIRNWLFCCDNT